MAGRLLQLAQHQIANFALQHVLQSVRRNWSSRGRHLLRTAYEELSPHIEELCAASRTGVVLQLLDACVRVQVKENKIFKLIASLAVASFEEQTPINSNVVSHHARHAYGHLTVAFINDHLIWLRTCDPSCFVISFVSRLVPSYWLLSWNLLPPPTLPALVSLALSSFKVVFNRLMAYSQLIQVIRHQMMPKHSPPLCHSKLFSMHSCSFHPNSYYN